MVEEEEGRNDRENGLNGPDKHYSVELPWYVDTAGKGVKGIGHYVKYLFFLALVGFGIWGLFQVFSWTWLIGLLTFPGWVMWSLHQMDKESYVLVERRIEGDPLPEGGIAESTGSNIYLIPPYTWQHDIVMFGEPQGGTDRIYFCNYFHPETNTIVFPSKSKYLNMDLELRRDLIVQLKKSLPGVEQENQILKWNIETLTEKRVRERLVKMAMITDTVEDPHYKPYIRDGKRVVRRSV